MTTERHASDDDESLREKGVFPRYLPWFFFGALLLWIILLAIGVMAEIFDIQSILGWWIFRV